MKRLFLIAALALGIFATWVYAAGSIVQQTPICFPNITVTNIPRGVDVTVAKGLLDIRSIVVDTGTNITTDGPCAPIYVKVPKLQSISVGGLTSVIEQSKYCIQPTGTFTFPYCPKFSIYTTNTAALRNLSIYTLLQGSVGEVLTNYIHEMTNVALNVAQAFSDVKTNSLGNAMQAMTDVKTNSVLNATQVLLIATTNAVDQRIFGAWFVVLTNRLDKAGFDTTAD